MGKKTRQQTFYLENLGCAKNQVDGEALCAELLGKGWLLVDEPEQADYLLVNTCGFIESAKRESIETSIGFRERFPDKKIIMTGCLTQRYGTELFGSVPEVDGIFGNRDLSRIGELLERMKTKKRDILLPAEYGALPRRKKLFSLPGSAYLKIAEGCSNRCSFCAIPLIRGGSRSRKSSEILDEFRDLLDAGVFEFNLVAQDLGSYGRDADGEKDLFGLLEAISALPGNFWVRLLYIHPEHFPRSLPDLCASDIRILPYFDIPFQHGADSILKAMGRRTGQEENLELICRLREKLPGCVLRSTFLVGFPGEGEREFEDLLSFQEKARFDWLGVFTYSPEEDTPAYLLHQKRNLRVPKRIAAARKKTVEERQIPLTEERMDRFIGRSLDVFVEELVQGEPLSLGRAYFHAPEVDGLIVLQGDSVRPGQVCAAKVIKRHGLDLEAVLL